MDRQMKFLCDTCGEIFDTSERYLGHLRDAHGVRITPVQSAKKEAETKDRR